MRSINGVVIGIVKSLDDPDQLGRVQLSFPWMNESEPESNWARIAAPMSGGERGFWFMPEVGDEVLVAFEQGNLTHPYVVGFLWNGQAKPPQTDLKKRTLKTVSGHTIELDDTDGSEKISLLWKGDKPGITLEKTKITVMLNDNCQITLEESKIDIKLNSTTFITLDSSGVTVKGAQIKLN
jgi:uncharacterized protein involved in type VI secretion and phage assembly